MAARGIAQRAGLGKVKALAGEDALAARILLEIADSNQGGVFEGEQGRLWDGSSTCGQGERFASHVWGRGFLENQRVDQLTKGEQKVER